MDLRCNVLLASVWLQVQRSSSFASSIVHCRKAALYLTADSRQFTEGNQFFLFKQVFISSVILSGFFSFPVGIPFLFFSNYMSLAVKQLQIEMMKMNPPEMPLFLLSLSQAVFHQHTI